MVNRLPPAWSKHLKAPAAPVAAPLPRAKPSPPAQTDDVLLRQAVELQQLKRFAEAQELCFRVLERTPNHPVALYVMGTLVLGFDDELALRYFARAIGENPHNPYFHLGLGEAYSMVGEHSSAIEHFQHALELQPDMVEVLCSLGRAYVRVDKAELALPLYEKALGINRDYPKIRTGLAGALTSLGRMDDAKVHLEEAIELRVAMPAAYNSLVNTRIYSEEPAELKAILRELDDPRLDPEGAENLHYAAGKVLNDLRRYQDAMDHFKKAKLAAGHKYDLESYRRWVDATIRVFSPQMLAAKAGHGNPSEVPVFVLGMPRSGTTLTEQICASHPDVHGAGELSKLRRAANGLGLTNTSAAELSRSVSSITGDLCKTLADEHLFYLRERAPSALRIVDKMPHNFELIGLIGILFPNARIIHCRRDAIDNCVSCFTQIFRGAHGYNADLRTLGLYYREYDRLMRHWEKLFPGRILASRYEELVGDQEAQSRRLVDFLGLPWDDACLRFFDRGGSVTTPSRWQVRQPIYKSSVKRWKNYENEIRPLIQALGDLADI
ncbi:tetratricopeptide repeat protein [Mesorhizobium sp. CU2]|uniref:tetratricopeptide repeat-containing sulfotransferase family protein n=1 Tax=unclassified Mesorhizobium TaxID=325217 RepID=UPI001125D0CF|nr:MULTISPECIES: sulfotransferase [unclassified Mesorhizobium]TPN76174.1 tetratricopeptide repeat protein [Mesorhizobium sp. CU3]TPO10475.1 tetratricopeptide repeat protein [Mesorhizobium sp. CU2]